MGRRSKPIENPVEFSSEKEDGEVSDVDSDSDSETSDTSSKQSDDDLVDKVEEHLASLTLKSSLDSQVHGTQIVSVSVGNVPNVRVFTIHFDLLSQTSTYFNQALRGCQSDVVPIIELPNHCPVAFEVVYRYLYGGYIWDYGVKDMANDFFWLGALKIAQHIKLKDLADGIYLFITQRIFSPSGPLRAPSARFIDELYKPTQPQHKLRLYIATLAVHDMIQPKFCSSKLWIDLFRSQPSLAVTTITLQASYYDSACTCPEHHPARYPQFLIGKLQPEKMLLCPRHDEEGEYLRDVTLERLGWMRTQRGEEECPAES